MEVSINHLSAVPSRASVSCEIDCASVSRRPNLADYPLSIKTKANHPGFLNGWKEIADYLGKGVRTVQRYELDLCLPIRRPAGRLRGSVIASRIEIEQWVMASPVMLSQMLFDLRQIRHDLRAGMFEMHLLCTTGNKLKEAVGMQCAALQSCVETVVRTLSEPTLAQRMERHRAHATEQRACARGMIKTAREMSDRAIEMRSQGVAMSVNC